MVWCTIDPEWLAVCHGFCWVTYTMADTEDKPQKWGAFLGLTVTLDTQVWGGVAALCPNHWKYKMLNTVPYNRWFPKKTLCISMILWFHEPPLTPKSHPHKTLATRLKSGLPRYSRVLYVYVHICMYAKGNSLNKTEYLKLNYPSSN